MSATPMAPPRLRTTLMREVALPIFSRAMLASATVFSGTKMKPTPTPCTKRGHASDQ